MIRRDKIKRLPLKTVYYLSFLLLIVIPIFVVLIAALLELNHQFKNQAIENIKRAQETMIADLESDEDVMSIRLSHMIYTNDNEILKYAAGTDSEELAVRNEYEKKLSQAVNLVLEPVKDIISVCFFMKDGRETGIKNDIKRSREELKESEWYQSALQKKNTVRIGYFDTEATNDLYTGSKKDSLILVFALAPNVSTDRSQKIEMVMFYQLAGVSERIKAYNRDYTSGKNKLGIAQITEEDGTLIFSTHPVSEITKQKYTCVRSPISFNDHTWYIENYIPTSKLTADFWNTAVWVLGAAVLVLSLAGYYSRYFLRSIVKPIEEISHGLRQVEEGNLEVHITAGGQFEIRSMIHQFNAMVRRLKALVNEYEDRIRSAIKSPGDYLASLLRKEMTPEEVNKRSKEFFAEPYAILGLYIDYEGRKEKGGADTSKLIGSFERNPRFASRCILYRESSVFLIALYRITESDYSYKITHMAEELQRMAQQELGVRIFVCIGRKTFGHDEFDNQVRELRDKIVLRYLKGKNSIIDLNQENERVNRILRYSGDYERLAAALYVADEKNAVQEKEKLFQSFNNSSIEEIRYRIYGAILAIGTCFGKDNGDFTDAFGQEYNYFEKIGRIEDSRSLKMWVTNYFAWIMEYSASKLNILQTDVIIKAKRYMADNYENAQLSLAMVADHVGLNEKYFTNRFTKETGETFTSYLTALRLQKAKELLKTTSFKIYEIAEMVGYNNAEHFNRMFKKSNGISPAQYRKES